jgi:hypothetical protein
MTNLALSPTNLYSEIILGVNDYRYKYATKRQDHF